MTWGAGASCPELLGNPTREAFLCTTDLEQAVVEKPLAALQEMGTASELTARGCTAELYGSMVGVDCALCHQRRKCCPQSSKTHCIPGLQNHPRAATSPCVHRTQGSVAEYLLQVCIKQKGKEKQPLPTRSPRFWCCSRTQSTAIRAHTAGAAVKVKPLVSVGSWAQVEKGSRFPQLLLSECDWF